MTEKEFCVEEKIEENITEVVDKRTREMEDRRRRECNVVAFNYEEGRFSPGIKNKEYYEETAMQ